MFPGGCGQHTRFGHTIAIVYGPTTVLSSMTFTTYHGWLPCQSQVQEAHFEQVDTAIALLIPQALDAATRWKGWRILWMVDTYRYSCYMHYLLHTQTHLYVHMIMSTESGHFINCSNHIKGPNMNRQSTLRLRVAPLMATLRRASFRAIFLKRGQSIALMLGENLGQILQKKVRE